MSKATQKFDRQLFDLKTRDLTHQMQAKSVASDNAALQGSSATGRRSALGGSALVRIVDGQLTVLRQWLEGIDRIAREVWEAQGEAITPEFVRDILLPQAIMFIDVRRSTVEWNVSRATSQFSEDHHQVIIGGNCKT